jgi:carbon monoxide dehydrogenase subunit G
MAVARRSRTIDAELGDIWRVIEDPHQMPRWWPGVKRMEGVDSDRWTQVLTTKKGRPVRADFHLLASEEPGLRRWEQEVIGTPFERVLDEAVTEVALEPLDGGTRVTIELRQKLRGSARTGGFLLRRASRRKLDEALDGLEQICGTR